MPRTTIAATVDPVMPARAKAEARADALATLVTRPYLNVAIFILDYAGAPGLPGGSISSATSTHAISNRSVVRRYRENGADVCRFANACPSAYPGKPRTCSRFPPIALESSALSRAHDVLGVPVGLRTADGSNFGTQRCRLRCRAARRGDYRFGHWSERCNETMAGGRPGDTAST
jgi:hypothetical protein